MSLCIRFQLNLLNYPKTPEKKFSHKNTKESNSKFELCTFTVINVQIGTQVNVILLNTNLPYYNTVDKGTSIMSKNIELGIISYVPLY